jgi:hypothetical protein
MKVIPDIYSLILFRPSTIRTQYCQYIFHKIKLMGNHVTKNKIFQLPDLYVFFSKPRAHSVIDLSKISINQVRFAWQVNYWQNRIAEESRWYGRAGATGIQRRVGLQVIDRTVTGRCDW